MLRDSPRGRCGCGWGKRKEGQGWGKREDQSIKSRIWRGKPTCWGRGRRRRRMFVVYNLYDTTPLKKP